MSAAAIDAARSETVQDKDNVMSSIRICRIGAAFWMASALTCAHAAEGYTDWDNFDGQTEIDSTRWRDFERTRVIEGKKEMRFIQRDLGSQFGNAGLYSSSWGMNLTNPSVVTQLRADVTVNDYGLTHCATNPEPSVVQARLAGGFFNSGPGVPTSRINDVGATIRLRRDSNSADGPGVLRVQGTVFQCTASDCNSAADLGSVDLGTAAKGETVTLKMEWDPANNRFNFYRGTDPVKRVNYATGDALAPYDSWRQIGTRTSMANCLDAPRTEGWMDAKFDNVYVNLSAAP